MDNENKDYLEVKVFAERANKSVQALYKRIRTDSVKIKPFVKYFDGTPKIHKTALKELYGINEEEQQLNQTKKVSKPFGVDSEEVNNKALLKMIELLEGQIEAQKEAIERRDKQIEELMELLKAHTKVLDQQQHLSAIDKSQVLSIESKESKERKRGWFSRLFDKQPIEK